MLKGARARQGRPRKPQGNVGCEAGGPGADPGAQTPHGSSSWEAPDQSPRLEAAPMSGPIGTGRATEEKRTSGRSRKQIATRRCPNKLEKKGGRKEREIWGRTEWDFSDLNKRILDRFGG